MNQLTTHWWPIPEIRFDPVRGCWLWQSSLNKGGYGVLSDGGRNTPARRFTAHRAAWGVFRGPIPEHLCVLHRCDVRNCVNPDHLFLGTNEENTQDRDAKRRQAFGSRNGSAKLTEEAVKVIRRRVAAGEPRSRLIAEYGVNKQSISQIVLRQGWRHV